LKLLAKRCQDNGQYFLFETGQETPVTLKLNGYRGALTIKREIEGEQQLRDIRRVKALLEQWVAAD